MADPYRTNSYFMVHVITISSVLLLKKLRWNAHIYSCIVPALLMGILAYLQDFWLAMVVTTNCFLPGLGLILLMAEIPAINHQRCRKPVVNNGTSYQPQLVQDFWTINSMYTKNELFEPQNHRGLHGSDNAPFSIGLFLGEPAVKFKGCRKMWLLKIRDVAQIAIRWY